MHARNGYTWCVCDGRAWDGRIALVMEHIRWLAGTQGASLTALWARYTRSLFVHMLILYYCSVYYKAPDIASKAA
jgi:hypothetical protein